jgi:hypothetical protein
MCERPCAAQAVRRHIASAALVASLSARLIALCFTKVGHEKCDYCAKQRNACAWWVLSDYVAFRSLIRRVQVPPRLERAVDELIARSESANQDLTTQANVMLAADRLSLQLRNAGASVANALPGITATFAAAVAIDSSGGLSGSGPATNRLLSLLISAVRVGVEAYAAAVRMPSARVAHLLTSFRTMSSCLNGQRRSRRDWSRFLRLLLRMRGTEPEEGMEE